MKLLRENVELARAGQCPEKDITLLVSSLYFLHKFLHVSAMKIFVLL